MRIIENYVNVFQQLWMKEFQHPLDSKHRRELSSGSSDGHRRDASWDSILSDEEQQQQQQQQQVQQFESHRIFKFGTLEIVAANSIIDDDTHEWRHSKSSPHLQPYRAPAREYRHFGHTDGNRATGFNAPGHVVPAVRNVNVTLMFELEAREYHFTSNHSYHSPRITRIKNPIENY